ncbi:MAG: histidine kinase [Frankiales bacterium]|nr:histidine kinase [Frankiales bacterium]
MRTLRWRLTAVATLVVLLGLSVGAFVLAAVLTRSRVAALGQLAATRAETVAALARAGRLPDVLPVVEPGEVVQVLDDAGGVVATSASASRTLPLMAPGDRPDRGVLRHSPYGPDPLRVETRRTVLDGRPVTVVAAVPLRDVLSAFRALRVALVVVVPVLSLGVGVLCFLLLGRALRPVDDLRRSAETVSSLGGGGTLPVPSAGELAALATTLNRMLDRLQVAGERQGAFVGDAAHELRSPLAAVRATVEVALAHPGSYDTGALAEDVLEQVLRLQRLVDDLLSLARVGATPVRDDDVDLRELAEQVASGRAEVVGHGVVVSDREALRRVLRNLVDNAVRHADAGVRVEVGDGVVAVQDDGPGVPEADRERVFARFARLDAARARDSGGTGLGLAISRETARALGGDVVLEPSPRGARFVLYAPSGKSAPRATSSQAAHSSSRVR